MYVELFLCLIFLITIIILIVIKMNVKKELPNSSEAMMMINDLKMTGARFVEYLKNKYPNDEGMILLSKRFNPNKIYEGSPFEDDFTYTENKGEKMVICVRNATNLQVHEKNLIMYPYIHELAHLCDKNYDQTHGDNFKKYFKILLSEANNIGIYKTIDFKNNPTNYCNMQIT